MRAINIKWDTDGDLKLMNELPTEIEIPDEIMDGKDKEDIDEIVSDYLSDVTGFCHMGFELHKSKYGISVREIFKRTVIVEANNLEEAIEKVTNAVECDELLLEIDDYDHREIVPSEYWEGGKIPYEKDVSYYWQLDED